MVSLINTFNNCLILLLITMNKDTGIKHTPYTYRIQCIPTGEYYYGVRYANGCHPNDLWVKYFTSSKDIHYLIKQHGKDAFICEIRKTFESIEAAIKWETRVNRHTINFVNYLNQNNGHRFSAISSSKGGTRCAELYKGSSWWNNGQKNRRSHTCPGVEWVHGYIRNLPKSITKPLRVKGEKQHWWNNGVDNILSVECPGIEWSTGMISGIRHWWNNGVDCIMCKESPGPDWQQGYSSVMKDRLSDIAIIDNRGANLNNDTGTRRTRGPSRYKLTERQKESFLNIVWWTNGEQEVKSRAAPNSTWKRGRLINKFNNNRESKWWTNGEEEIRTHEILSPEWIMGRKPRQLP